MAGFPRRARLLRPPEFQQVFDGGRRKRNASFTAIEKPNQLEHARLGLAVAKKVLPRAVDRNRFKRLVRESFRNAVTLPPCDVVILVAPPAKTATAAQIAEQLRHYWSQFPDRWPRS